MKPYQSFSIFSIILLLLMPNAYAFELFGHEVNVDTGDVASLAVGAAVAGAAIVLAPVVAGVVIGGGIAANYIYRELTGKNSNDGAVVTDGNVPTTGELVNDTDITSTLVNLQSNAEEEASKDILALRQQLQSSMVSYDIETSGSLADIRVGIKGSDKIYGFSGFPLSVNIYAPCAVDPSENKVHIQEVTAYVKDTVTGQIWWKQTWTGDQILRNNDYTWNFLLKTPDPYYGKAKSIIDNIANKETLEELLKAEVNKFEVHVEINGYREVWAWKTVTHEDGTTTEVLVHVRDDQISADITSLSAWLHESSGMYEIDGAEGSLPAKFADVRDYTAYKIIANGAVSNLIARAWATPVHIFDSTADYKLCFLANPDYFGLLQPTITDDVAVITFRTQYDGSSAISSQVKDSFGDLGTINTIATSLNYKTVENTVAFDTYVLMYATVKSGDRELPIWLIAKPAITVLSNKEVVFSDEKVTEIASILQKDEITEQDIEQIKQIATTMKAELEKKKQTATDLKAKCANNDVAEKYAEKSIDYYGKAIRALDELQSTNNAEQIATQLKLAKNYEMIADYYADATEKALYGQIEQAEIDVENAQKLEEVTKQYEPSVWFSAGSWLGDSWQSFKEGFGIGTVPDWVLILVVVILIVGGAVIVLKLF